MPGLQRTLTVTFANGRQLKLEGKVDADLDQALRASAASELSSTAANKLVGKIFKNHRLGAGEQLAATALSATCMLGRSVKAVEYAGSDRGKDFVRALGMERRAGREIRAQLNEELYQTSGRGTATVLQILAGEAVLDPARPAATVELRPARPPLPKKEWTILVYYSADNDLAPYALADLKEMKDGFAKVSSFVNVVILYDNPLATGPSPGLDEAYASPTQVLVLEHDREARGQPVKVRPVQVHGNSRLGRLLSKTGGYLNMASGESLRAAREFAASFAPSKHSMLVLSGHGEGPLGSMGDDSAPYPDDLLRPHELRSALQGSAKPIDVIAFDACTMQDAAVADLAEEVGAKLLVASEEIEPQRGWQWRKLFETMARARKRSDKLQPAELGRAAVETYSGYTLSCVDATKAKAIWTGLDELGRALREAGGRDDVDIEWAVQSAERYDVDGDTVDIVDFCKLLKDIFTRSSDVYQAAHALSQTVKSAVLRRSSTGTRAGRQYGNSHGLAIYLPLKADAVDPRQLGRVTGKPASSWSAFVKGE